MKLTGIMDRNGKFLICALAVFVLYFYYGILHEKITRGNYTYETVDENGKKTIEIEKFSYSSTLVFTQCFVNFLVVASIMYIRPEKEDKTSKFYYLSLSTTYLLGMVSSTMALRWVPYPTQVVGKSAKPIPVMILGVLLGKKSYTLRKYVCVFLIVIGMILFMFKDKNDGKSVLPSSGIGIGEILLILSLLMDGLTGGVQDRIRAESSPSGHQMMKATNRNSMIIILIIILATGEAFNFIKFAQRHLYVLYDIAIFCLTQSIGQLFLFTLVSDFGPLPVSIVTTTRKCFTVLFSVLFFGNTLILRQQVGAAVVFAGLFLDIFYSARKSQKSGEKALK